MSFESSFQSTKDTISGFEKDLHFWFGWFEYKLREVEGKLKVAVLGALNLEEVINGLNAEVEL